MSQVVTCNAHAETHANSELPGATAPDLPNTMTPLSPQFLYTHPTSKCTNYSCICSGPRLTLDLGAFPPHRLASPPSVPAAPSASV